VPPGAFSMSRYGAAGLGKTRLAAGAAAIVGVVMSRFAIVVTDGRTGNKLELCRVGTNPEPVAEGARRKTYKLGKRVLRLYSNVEVVEIAKGAVVRS